MHNHRIPTSDRHNRDFISTAIHGSAISLAGLLTGLALFAGGCGSNLASAPAPATQQAMNPPVVAPDQLPRLEDVLTRLADHRVVYVGETHTRFDHHLLQLEVLKHMHQTHGDVAVGAEWFQYPFQQSLDDFIAGRISEAEMLERTGYYERWRFDWRLYRPILQYAREHRIPVVALNAPRELTSEIGSVGIGGLSETARLLLPDSYDRSDQAYRQRLADFYGAHPETSGNFEHFYEVMLTWDETMAQRVAQHLQEHPGRRMVVMAGAGHVEYGAGIPDRVARRIGERGPVLLADWQRATEPGIADYIVLSEPMELAPLPLLGVYLQAGEEGAEITGVTDSSALGDAGIVAGDVLLAIGDMPVRNLTEVKLALIQHANADSIAIRYRAGNGSERLIDVTPRQPKGSPHALSP